MALKLTILSLLALCVVHSHSFTAPSTHSKRTTTAFIPKTTSTSLNLNIPRINLPEAVGNALESIDLQNPNKLSTEDYNAYRRRHPWNPGFQPPTRSRRGRCTGRHR